MTTETSNARGEWVLVPARPTDEMLDAGMGKFKPGGLWSVYAAMVAAAPPPAAARGDVRGLEYVPGRLDREAPARVWLQIDTTGDNDERDDAWPGPEHVTWQDESIGGLEIQYVRADLAIAAEGVQAGEDPDLTGYYNHLAKLVHEHGTAKVEQRARELLAAEYQKRGHGRESAEARASYIERHECAAFDAIARALSQQPEARGVVDGIVRAVAELPDRNSPEDWPEAMLVTADELTRIVGAALTEARNVR